MPLFACVANAKKQNESIKQRRRDSFLFNLMPPFYCQDCFYIWDTLAIYKRHLDYCLDPMQIRAFAQVHSSLYYRPHYSQVPSERCIWMNEHAAIPCLRKITDPKLRRCSVHRWR